MNPMHKAIKEKPATVITIITSIITALSGAGYGGYVYLEEMASKSYVKEQIVDLNLEVIGVAIMRYEDELMSIDFLIETDSAKPMDKVSKKNIERRLQDLKSKRTQLENSTR